MIQPDNLVIYQNYPLWGKKKKKKKKKIAFLYTRKNKLK